MTAPWYDTEEGIREALARDLQGFAELRSARRTGYAGGKGWQLHNWLVLGRYWLDRCGNTLTLAEPLHDRGRVSGDASFVGAATLAPIAPHNHTCTRCGQPWTLRDAHDYRPIVGPDSAVTHLHTRCRVYAAADEARTDLTAAVREAGIAAVLLAVPNRYGREDYAGPWFTAHTEQLGRITVGWRKRVVQIEWERGPDGREVFAAEEVTKGARLVHAWSLHDVARYLTALLSASEKPC